MINQNFIARFCHNLHMLGQTEHVVFCNLMTPATLPQLAKRGDLQAITALLNRSHQPKGVIAKTALVGECLKVMVEAEAAPNQTAVVKFIANGLMCLSPEKIAIVRLSGKRTGENVPLWEQQFDLQPISQLPTLALEEQVESTAIEPKPKVVVYGSSKKEDPTFLNVLKSVRMTVGTLLAR